MEPFSVLDVGAGSCDTANVIRRSYPKASVVSLDRSERNLRAGEGTRIVADAFRLPFQPRSFDYVFCSLFLHHFEDLDVLRLLEVFGRLARRGVFLTDLERHWIPSRFLNATSWLFGWNEVTLHDGPVSVRAAFTREELEILARSAGLNGVEVRRCLPWFRLSLAWERPS